MANGDALGVKVWGELACFTRPEMKVERVTYPVMTPSAARGILEAIFWKPEFAWRIREIWVLRPIHYVSLVRNEINSRQSFQAAKAWVEGGGGFYADEDRAQRHTLALRDVSYVIWADMRLHPHATDPPVKYREQFRRRVARGQCFQQPYLGCREFVAYFAEPEATDRPLGLTMDLGLMLFEPQFEASEQGPIRYAVHAGGERRLVRGQVQPRFFAARLEWGVLRVPEALYEGEPGHAS